MVKIKSGHKRNYTSMDGDTAQNSAPKAGAKVIPPTKCSTCTEPPQIPSLFGQLGFSQMTPDLGLPSLMQDPFTASFSAMAANFSPMSSLSCFPAMTMTQGAFNNNNTTPFQSMLNSSGILGGTGLSTFNSLSVPAATVTNGLIMTTPYDHNPQNLMGLDLSTPTPMSSPNLTNTLLPMMSTVGGFSNRTEFDELMESAATTFRLTEIPGPAITKKAGYTVVNNGFHSTTIEDETEAAASANEVEHELESNEDVEKDESDTEDEKPPTQSRRKSSRRKSSRSRTHKRNGDCTNGKCSVSVDKRRRSRKRSNSQKKQSKEERSRSTRRRSSRGTGHHSEPVKSSRRRRRSRKPSTRRQKNTKSRRQSKSRR